MLPGWLDARRATEIGISLADHLASGVGDTPAGARRERARVAAPRADSLRDFLQRAEREIRAIPLNFYKKAKLANAFKWRLLEQGVAGHTAAELTQALVTHLSISRVVTGDGALPSAPLERSRSRKSGAHVLAEAGKCVARGAYAEAVNLYHTFLERKPNDARVLTNLGEAYWMLGLYREAEARFRHAIRVRPQAADAHANLGVLLRGRGLQSAAENSLRRALKLEPQHLEARAALGWTLFDSGRLPEARQQFDKVLKLSPRHVGALLGLARIAKSEGRFTDAEAVIQRILQADPDQAVAWAALAELRKMTRADHAWVERAEAIASAATTPLHELDLRFAIGKYYDDVGEFASAFASYRRANQLLKEQALPYDRQAREGFVEDLMRSHSRERLENSSAASHDAARNSSQPVFVVGMMRSGTSLVEQIIASHPAAAGAGELHFWTALVQRHEADLRQAPLAETLREATAHDYLRELARHAEGAMRVVDKATVNSDYLGIIHTVFPNARIIYLRRNPIDTCLSCYFQHFSAGLSFTMDLDDLAHYYRTH